MITGINIQKLSVLFFSIFFIFIFVNKDISNLSMILLLITGIASLFYNFPIKNNFLPLKTIFILCSMILIVSQLHASPLHEIDNYMRFILLLPIYFLFTTFNIKSNYIDKLLQIAGIAVILLYLIQHYNISESRYQGPSSSPITYANLIMTLILFLLSSYLRTKNNEKYFKLFILLLLFYICFETGSKGAIVGFITGLIAITLCQGKRTKGIIIIIILIVPLSLTTAVSDKFKIMYSSLVEINVFDFKDSTELNASENERLYYYFFSLREIAKNPVYGIGPNKFETELRKDINQNNLRITARDHSHNEFLDLAVKFGIPVVLAFIYILFFFTKVALKSRSHWLSELLLINVFSQIGFMLTQSQLAHHQSTVFFIVVTYILSAQIFLENKKNYP